MKANGSCSMASRQQQQQRQRLLPTAVTALLLLAVTVPARCQDCPCDLRSSTVYEGKFVWDCSELALTDVPGDCFSIRSSNVSEFLLSHNLVQDIRSTSLIELTDLRVIRLDNNNLNFVDPTAFEFMHQLQILNIDHNLDLTLDYETFSFSTELMEVSTIGTNLGSLPNLAMSPVLNRVDIRSSALKALPMVLLHPQLNSSSFYLNFHGNLIADVAVQTLLPLPDNSIVNMDNAVLLWARTEAEKEALLAKPWTSNVDLAAATRVCEAEGLPGDLSICFGEGA